jgi:HEAT repeat protein
MSTSTRTRYILLACFVVVLAAVYVLLQRQPGYAGRVEVIMSSGQSYDGEYVDRLADLGPRAVPAISDAMLNPQEQFPAVYVLALRQIGDPSAAKPLIEFLERQDPRHSSENVAQIVLVIDALAVLKDAAAVDPLRQIMHAESAHPRVRLSAAAALARTGSPVALGEAREFIFQMYEQRDVFLRMTPQGRELSEADLYSAVAAADTDRSVSILSEVLRGEPDPWVAIPVIAYFAGKDTSEAAVVLDDVMTRTNHYDLYLRIEALEGLLDDSPRPPEEELLERVTAMQAEARADGHPRQVVESIDAIARDLERRP